MKKTVTVIVASLSFVFAAGATELPRYETFLGYQFTRFNTNLPSTVTPLVTSGGLSNFDAHGGSAQFIYNFNHWLGLAFDAGAVTNANLTPLTLISLTGVAIPNFDTTVTHFVAGPRFTWHNESRFKPYAEALFGGAYGTASFRCDPTLTTFCGTNPVIGPLSSRVQIAHTVYAMMIGGGLDIKVSRRFFVRPAGFDYYMTRPPTQAVDFFAPGFRSDRNNWRYTAGVVFGFGAQ